MIFRPITRSKIAGPYQDLEVIVDTGNGHFTFSENFTTTLATFNTDKQTPFTISGKLETILPETEYTATINK